MVAGSLPAAPDGAGETRPDSGRVFSFGAGDKTRGGESVSRGRVLRFAIVLLVVMFLLASGSLTSGQPACTLEDFEYVNDGLRIRGQLMRPSGPGPFPVVIWNHGDGRWREKEPLFHPKYSGQSCADFTRYGWIYFFPDRRGAGRSEGPQPPWTTPGFSDYSKVFPVLDKWTTGASHDVLGGLPYLKSLGFADMGRVAIVGYSGGADPTVFAAGAAPAAFRAVVLQAGGWPAKGDPDRGLTYYIKWAKGITAPILLQHGKQDTGVRPEFARAFAKALKGMGKDVTLLEYDGDHGMFGPAPSGVWQKDFVDFLTRQFSKAGP